MVFTHCRASAHDRYFFQDPRGMIAGEIRVPSFSLRNEPMLRKHVHSMAHDPEHNRIYAQKDQKTEGGGKQAHQVFTSFELADVEMARREDINDREKGRRRVGFKILSLDMGTNEIEGEVICDEHGDHHALLYDPMPGGSGFLPQIIEYWDAVCEAAQKALESCASNCDKACYSCMKHFRNQQDHAVLDRHMALNMLSPLIQPLDLRHKIPPVAAAIKAEIEKTDSDAEVSFADVCTAHSFPVPPVAGLKITFDDGNYTVADWAYPEAKLLIFIDGMGKHLHGDPQKAKSDALKRAKAELLGYKVVAITAEALKDEVSMSVHFQVIKMHLDKA